MIRRLLRGRARALCLVLTVVLLSTAACGVPLDSSPTAVLSEDIDPDLLRTVAPTAEPEVANVESEPIFLLDNAGKLSSVTRQVVASPQGVLTALLAGPTEDEQQRGFSTALTQVEIGGVTLTELQNANEQDGNDIGTIAFVDLTEDSLTLSSRSEQLAAFGQIVYTLTALEDVALVSFTRGGEQVRIPTDAGSIDPGTAVDEASFESLTRRPSVGFVDETGSTPTNVSVYFVNQANQLQPVARRLRSSPQELLSDLFIGPSVSETALGLTSAMSDTATANVTLEPELVTAIIDLRNDTALPATSDDAERRRALGQIVMTITELANVEFVRVLLDGQPQDMLGDADEAQLFERGDFTDLLVFAP